MKRCLLIGGAGFIGTNLAHCLSGADYEVTVCDCVAPELLPDRIADMNYVELNYFEQLLEDELLRKQDMVVLLISSVGPNSSMSNPEVCYEKDIVRMIELLNQMRRCNVRRLVFISSGGTVYGNQNVPKLKEDMATYPINHYGIMKLTQEKILLMYNKLYGMRNVIFRLSNPYGEGQKMSSGIGAVTAFLQSIMNGERIHIYGQGEAVRDYIYIDDAVNMICLFFKNCNEDKTELLYNIGTGEGSSIIDVLRMAEKTTGKKADVIYLEKREIDVTSNVLDTSKIRSVIGDYKCLPLEEGMEKYCKVLKGKLMRECKVDG